jgi:hypothetical protein
MKNNNYEDVQSELKRWHIKDSIVLKGKDDPREATHLLLDGGRIHISEKAVPIFQRKYAADIEMKRSNFILEVKTPIYKLIMDLDTYETVDRTYEEMRPWLCEIQKVVADMYPTLTPYARRVVVCTTNSTPDKFKNTNVYTKLGLGHLIWPDININNETGLKFRAAILQHMEKIYGKRHVDNPWEDVIDKTIYKQNGLRMIGSAKCAVCNSCKKQKQDFCDTCHGQTRYYIGRIYYVQEVIDGDGNSLAKLTEKIQNDTLIMVQQTSLRTYEHFITEQSVPVWFDNWYYEQELEIITSRKKFYGGNHQQLTSEDQKGFTKHDRKARIEKDDTEYRAIRRMINSKMPAIYKNVSIMDIHMCNRGENTYYLVRTNSGFCMNVARDHNSNTIYFVVTEYGICQKCFCQCNTIEGRKFGLCNDYHSNMIPLTSKEKQNLFPNVVKGKSTTTKNKYIPNDINNEKKLLKELLQNKLNEMQMWQDYLDGKSNFEQRFDKPITKTNHQKH